MNQIYEKYKTLGLACLPTKEDKSPYCATGWKRGITDGYDQSHGIGIICGSVSGGIECIDFDNHFGDAKDILSRFLAINEVNEIYKNYSPVIESTVSGGFHLLYRSDKVEGNRKLAERPKHVSGTYRPDAIIETRGEGGYFVAAPTPGYKVIRGSFDNIPSIPAEERDILIQAARSFNEWSNVRRGEQEQQDRPGDIYNTSPGSIDEMKSALLAAGWEEVANGQWRRPGKNRGISATLGKVADNVFYCFSSNGHPFEPNAGYTPFQVVGLLKYNGDFSAFAKDLSDSSNRSKTYTTDTKGARTGKTDSELESMLTGAMIDLDIPVKRPPVCMKIREQSGTMTIDRRLFTLGNFSAITGKGKSKKTFLASLLTASATKNGIIDDKFISDFPSEKSAVLLFDTEQSLYDAYQVSERVYRIAGGRYENFGAFALREYSPRDRCNIIEYALKKFSKSIAFVVIDGIADLANAINDEEEATRVVSLLLRWTKVYNCHITTVIHQNKNDEYATGHLGSSIIKKAEAVIKVTKDPVDYTRSRVSCDLIRGVADFRDFEFYISSEGLPSIDHERTTINEFAR